jgi:hypothetical protein
MYLGMAQEAAYRRGAQFGLPLENAAEPFVTAITIGVLCACIS